MLTCTRQDELQSEPCQSICERGGHFQPHTDYASGKIIANLQSEETPQKQLHRILTKYLKFLLVIVGKK